MASYNSTTFGDIKGKHGTAVATSGKRGNILRVFTAPTNVKTYKQLAQRNKFGFVTSNMQYLRDLMNYTYRGNGGYEAAVSAAFQTAVSGTSPDFTFDITKLPMVYGSNSVSNSGDKTATVVAGSTVEISWYTGNIHVSKAVNQGSNILADDEVFAIFCNEELKESYLFDLETKRKDGQSQIELPEHWAGSKSHCWIYFSRASGSMNSIGSYVGELQF